MKYAFRALGYLKQHRRVAVGAFAGLLIVNIANLFTPQILRSLIDNGILKLNLEHIRLTVILLFIVALLRGLFDFYQGYLSEVASQEVAFDLRNTIFEKLQKLSFSYHDQTQTGRLMTRMTSDVEVVRMFVGPGIIQLLSAGIMLFGISGILFWMNWRLALIEISIIPLIGLIIGLMMRKVFPLTTAVQQNLASLNTILQENIAGVRIVRAFARESYELGRYEKQNQELYDINIDFQKLFTTLFPMIFFIANLGIVAVIWIGGGYVIDQSVSLGDLVAFISYVALLLLPLFNMGLVGANMSRAAASAKRLFEVIDADSEVVERQDADNLEDVEGDVEFDSVSFRYAGAEENTLRDVSFKVSKGQTIAVLGKTGSGKSTIINLIPRFYDVTEGAIRIDGRDIRDLKLDSLRSNIGVVLQEVFLFSGSIFDNIAFGLPNASIDQVKSAAAVAQAADFIDEFPNKYDTKVGEKGIGLSGGQKQRIAIARAVLINPKILIMDDSTSAVDSETEFKILNALDNLRESRTSFVIAQRIGTVYDADKLLILENGRVAALGTYQDLLESSELFNEILQSQFGDQVDQKLWDGKDGV